jgi:ABC-type oligopeptide transport system ATPase subunit
VTHDISVVRHVSHRVVVMNRGSIVEQGTAEAVTTTPQDPYTQRLMLAAPVPDPERQAARRAQLQALNAA